MTRKIRDIIRDLRNAGFEVVKGEGDGDHVKWRHPTGAQVHLDGRPGDDADHYQEKQLRQQIKRARDIERTRRKESEK